MQLQLVQHTIATTNDNNNNNNNNNNNIRELAIVEQRQAGALRAQAWTWRRSQTADRRAAAARDERRRIDGRG
jgi:hypothetical protein